MNRDNLAMIAWGLVLLITAPIWIPVSVIWCISTGNTPRTAGEEANNMSEVDE